MTTTQESVPQRIRRRGQLSFAGFEEPRAFGRMAGRGSERSRATPTGGAAPRSTRAPRRSGHQPGVGPARVLVPEEQLEVLSQRLHLLRPKEREWVAKIARTAAARGPGSRLSLRQCEVVSDIFDRVRDRVTR